MNKKMRKFNKMLNVSAMSINKTDVAIVKLKISILNIKTVINIIIKGIRCANNK
jgi:hypothetical protein